MNCIGPLTPEDFELLAYADGEASPEVTAHLARCIRCRTRAEGLREELSVWQKALHRAGCPPALELGEHSQGMLPPERAAQVAEHLRYCRACASEAATITEFMGRMEDARLRSELADARDALRKIKARLVSWGANLGEGFATPLPRAVREVRGPYLGDTPPLTYDAENFLLTFEFWPEDDARTRHIVGLVAGPDDFAGAEVEIIGGDGAPQRASLDYLGSFSLPGVSLGAHRLRVRLPTSGAQVEIDDFTVS